MTKTDYDHIKFYTISALVLTVFLIMLILPTLVGACPKIDLDAIKQIESSGNAMAWNRADNSRGHYQITPICLAEWNNYHPSDNHVMDDLWDPATNEKIARWYLNERIPQMLRYYKKPITIRNIIIAYNAGISYVVNGESIPLITQSYLKKYKNLTKN